MCIMFCVKRKQHKLERKSIPVWLGLTYSLTYTRAKPSLEKINRKRTAFLAKPAERIKLFLPVSIGQPQLRTLLDRPDYREERKENRDKNVRGFSSMVTVGVVMGPAAHACKRLFHQCAMSHTHPTGLPLSWQGITGRPFSQELQVGRILIK